MTFHRKLRVVSFKAITVFLLGFSAHCLSLNNSFAQQGVAPELSKTPTNILSPPVDQKNTPEADQKAPATVATVDKPILEKDQIHLGNSFMFPPASRFAPIYLNLPNPIRIESKSLASEPSPSSSGWLTFFGVILAALFAAAASIAVGFLTFKAAEKLRDLTSNEARRERQLKLSLLDLELETRKAHFKEEQSERRRQADQLHQATEKAEFNKTNLEQRRIAIELERAGFQVGVSSNESYLAAIRFVHDRQNKEIDLLSSLADKLLGSDERQRLFALLLLSAYVDPEIIKRLSEAGEEVIPTANLKLLVESDDIEISKMAKYVISKRSNRGT